MATKKKAAKKTTKKGGKKKKYINDLRIPREFCGGLRAPLFFALTSLFQDSFRDRIRT